MNRNPSQAPRRKKPSLLIRILRLKKSRLVVLAIFFTAPVLWLGHIADSLKKIAMLFPEASRHADEIAKIRSEVETQRNAIGVILRDSNSARSDIDNVSKLAIDGQTQVIDLRSKALEVESIANQAKRALEDIRVTTDLTFLAAKAEANDRGAFEKLIPIANDRSHQFHDLAFGVVRKIVDQVTFTMEPKWDQLDVDPKTGDFTELVTAFQHAPIVFQPAVLTAIYDQQRFSRFDRLKFLADTIRTTRYVSVLKAACLLMDKESKLEKNAVAFQEHLDWWYAHMAEVVGLEKTSIDPVFPADEPALLRR